jgi:hypothetical protein
MKALRRRFTGLASWSPLTSCEAIAEGFLGSRERDSAELAGVGGIRGGVSVAASGLFDGRSLELHDSQLARLGG